MYFDPNTTDFFEAALLRCKDFNNNFNLDLSSEKAKSEWLRKFIEYMTSELDEVRRELPWKHWKDYSDFTRDDEAVLGELIDVLIFWLGACAIMGYDAQQIKKMFWKKMLINDERQEEGY